MVSPASSTAFVASRPSASAACHVGMWSSAPLVCQAWTPRRMRSMPAAWPVSRADDQPAIISPAADQKIRRCSSATREDSAESRAHSAGAPSRVLRIGGNVMGKGEGQRILQLSGGGKRVVDERLAAIEVAGDGVRESGIDAADDERRFTVLAQAGIDRQAGTGFDALLEGIDGAAKATEAQQGCAQRAIGQSRRFRRRVIPRQRREPFGDLAGILEIGTVVDAVPQAAQRPGKAAPCRAPARPARPFADRSSRPPPPHSRAGRYAARRPWPVREARAPCARPPPARLRSGRGRAPDGGWPPGWRNARWRERRLAAGNRRLCDRGRRVRRAGRSAPAAAGRRTPRTPRRWRH